MAAAVAVSGLTSAACGGTALTAPTWAPASAPPRGALVELEAATVSRLFAFADGVTSCHTGGGATRSAASFLGDSFESVARAMLVVPLRHRGETIGLLVATSGGSRDIGSEAVEATELLGMHVGAAHLAL